MNDSDFITVFNVAEAGYRNWWFPAFGLIFVALGICTIFPTKLVKIKSGKGPIRLVLLSFAVFWTVLSFAGTYLDYTNSRRCLLSGRAEYIEGTVENFVEVPAKSESFSVAGVPFSYSDNVVSAGFNRTSSFGGPVRPGQDVKIWYRAGRTAWSNEILKFEIRKSGS